LRKRGKENLVNSIAEVYGNTMAKDSKKGPSRPEEISKIHGKLAGHFDELSKLYASHAQNYGFARELNRDYERVYQQVPDHPDLEGNKVYLTKFEEYVEAKKDQIKDSLFDISSSGFVVSTSVAVDTAIVLHDKVTSPFDIGGLKLSHLPPWWNQDTMEKYAVQLDNLKARLGDLLRSAWENLHGKIYEAERGAFGSMRTLFDQLIWVVGPDEAVSDSGILKEKKNRQDKIDRGDRLKFGVRTRISNPDKKDYLESQIDAVLKSYKVLQRLHQPGKIDPDIARDALIAIATFLFEFLDAVTQEETKSR